MKIVLLAVVLGLLFMGWRQWSHRRGAQFLERYPLSEMLAQRLAARHPTLTVDQQAEVIAALLDFFHLCRIAGRRQLAMPSQVADDAWHEFILFTRRYAHFCRHAFGRFLHHTPVEAMRSQTEATEGIRRAWYLACKREGIDPKKPDRLPRLFALDAQLGIAGGFVYHLDCMAAGQAGSKSEYCASHIGCGGGAGCAGGGCSGSADGSGCSGGGGCGGD